MIFSELYGNYFNVVAEILSKAVDGNLKQKDINDIIVKKAFGESALNIPFSLKSEKWKLIDSNMQTPILNKPSMPLTTLQKQWLKAISNDPRIKLFDLSFDGLEDVEPLYKQEFIEYFDRYNDGDDFDDEDYIINFRLILKAIKESRKMNIKYNGRSGLHTYKHCIPYHIEYSSKDDKFRLFGTFQTNSATKSLTLNLKNIKSIKLLGQFSADEYCMPKAKTSELSVIVSDERNCLERFMLHFSHLEKETQRIDSSHYKVKLIYDCDDETEMLIRILSFGPMVKVVSPKHFIEQIKERITKQKSCEA